MATIPALPSAPAADAAPIIAVQPLSRSEHTRQLKRQSAVTRGNILFFFGVLLALGLAWKLLKELEILYVAALFAVVLMPVVQKICQIKIAGRHPSRPVAIILLIVAVLLALTLFFVVALPPMIENLRQFVTDLPQRLPIMVSHIKTLPLATRFSVDESAQKLQGFLTSAASFVFASLPNLLSHFVDILTAAFLCLYFMLEGEHAYTFLLALFPLDERARLDATLRKAELKMSKWLLGQGLLMLSLGVCSIIAFGLFHVRYFFFLGVLMGLLNIIPVAGAIVTVGLVAIVAATDSFTKMFSVLAFYLVYLNVENVFLTPRIMKSSVNLMGLTVLVALLIGSSLAGITGALVAVPTAALVVVLLDEYAVQKDPEAQAAIADKE